MAAHFHQFFDHPFKSIDLIIPDDECAKRFLAPAGMTGLWQIKKRGKKDMSVEERINLDIDYANKYSFMYDLWIMANTPSALIQKSSA